MKKISIDLFFVFIFSLFLLCPVLAEGEEYTVKFKEDFSVPYSIKKHLTVVKEEKNLYTTRDVEKISGYMDFTERVYKNSLCPE